MDMPGHVKFACILYKLAEYVALEHFMHNLLGMVSFSQACLSMYEVVMETVT